MTEHSGGFDADLCVSTKPVIIGLSVVGTVLLFLSNTPRSIGDRHAVVPFSASLLVFSWVAWCIRERRSLTVRWLIVGVLTGAVLISSWWSQSPEVPVLLTLPAALCAALIGFPAAIAVVAEQTVVVLLYSRWLLPAPTVVAVTWLVAAWGVLGVVYMIYSPVRGVASWAWDY